MAGPADFTFRGGDDVIPGCDVPAGVAAVLAGHIHRSQRLTHDLRGRPLAAPVLYPGSIERTSFAEKDEEKGYLVVEVAAGANGGTLVGSRFCGLPARPLVRIEIDGPDGFRHVNTLDVGKPTALFFRASGKKLNTASWPTGTYKGHVSLLREDRVISRHGTQIEIGG